MKFAGAFSDGPSSLKVDSVSLGYRHPTPSPGDRDGAMPWLSARRRVTRQFHPCSEGLFEDSVPELCSVATGATETLHRGVFKAKCGE